MTKILITGSAGFIGSSLAEKLHEVGGNELVLVDDFSTGLRSNLPDGDGITFVNADANQQQSMRGIFEEHRPDYVYHYAAVVGVERTLENPLDVLNDIQGFKVILDLCVEFDVQKVLYASSSEVYGEPVEVPLHEETSPLNAKLPYAVVKNIGECYVRSYNQVYGLPYTIFRFFNTYGPRQSADFVMSRFIDAALKGDPITVYGDGQQSRTFGYIDDNVDTTILSMTHPEAENTVVNIGSDVPTTVLKLAEMVVARTGSNSKIVHLPALKEGDMTRRQPDNSKMRQILGRELTPLEAGMDKVIKHKRDQLGIN